MILVVAACGAPRLNSPSLGPRPAETIDPRVAVPDAPNTRPVAPELAERLASLIAEARRGDGAFQSALGEAQRSAAAAGAPQSESWVVAQQALSAAVAARRPTTRALGDVDALGAEALARQGGLSPADLAAIEAAAAEIAALDRRQAAAVAAIAARLRG